VGLVHRVAPGRIQVARQQFFVCSVSALVGDLWERGERIGAWPLERCAPQEYTAQPEATIPVDANKKSKRHAANRGDRRRSLPVEHEHAIVPRCLCGG
jgi:hypothetical protein